MEIGVYSQRLADRGIALDELVVDENGTLCAPLSAAPSTATRTATSAPPSAAQSRLPDVVGPVQEIVIGELISRGGMGDVLQATQTSLGREVAVKRARAGPGETEGADELIAEGRVTGHLQHPNIVPVHLLGRGDDGQPLLVMKRIEGQSWSALLQTSRDLRRDITILMDVCRALHFAHSRGVLHRDVKPANVMVGSFGEVYLVDWGIAAALSPQAPPGLERADAVTSVVGTPGYMAPEMALPGTAVLDTRTDVFLVGAVLFELMQGRSPFRASSIQASLALAASGKPPPLSPDQPEELVAICRRAMATNPDDRHPTCDALRTALDVFLGHTTSRELCAEAEERLAQIQALPADADPRIVLQLLAECRFGFTQALRGWPTSERARNGLASALQTVARREIDGGRLESARLLLDELETVPAELASALEALDVKRAREVQSVAELARVAHDTDQHVGDKERARLLYASAVSWAVVSVVFSVLASTNTYQAGAGTLAVWEALSVASLLVLRLRQPSIASTRAARAAFMSMVVSPLSLVVLHLVCLAVGLGLTEMLAVSTVLLGASIADRAAVDPRVWPSAITIWAALPVLLAWPQHGYLIVGMGVALGISGTAIVARRPNIEDDDADR